MIPVFLSIKDQKKYAKIKEYSSILYIMQKKKMSIDSTEKGLRLAI